MLRAVLLDVDGTLVDSNDAHARGWLEAFAEQGIHVAYDRVRPLIGMGGDKLLPALTGLRDDEPGGKELVARRSALFLEKYAPHLRAFPGAYELCTRVREAGLEIVVATSAKAEEVDAILSAAKLREAIPRRTTASDAEDSKPDPDIVAAALRRAKVSPHEAILVGDTPYDVEAASRAGVRAIAFRCGGWWSDDDLSGALALYDGPLDLLRRFDFSPLAARIDQRDVDGPA